MIMGLSRARLEKARSSRRTRLKPLSRAGVEVHEHEIGSQPANLPKGVRACRSHADGRYARTLKQPSGGLEKRGAVGRVRTRLACCGRPHRRDQTGRLNDVRPSDGVGRIATRAAGIERGHDRPLPGGVEQLAQVRGGGRTLDPHPASARHPCECPPARCAPWKEFSADAADG